MIFMVSMWLPHHGTNRAVLSGAERDVVVAPQTLMRHAEA